MPQELVILLSTAASMGFIHTLLGPDHYLPFIAMSRARNWSTHKTLSITTLCGLGHILSSVVLGFIGIVLGIAVFKLEAIESLRGDMAAWFLIIFGFTYFVWGLRAALRGKHHVHFHEHDSEGVYIHSHDDVPEGSPLETKTKRSITPWILFTIFVFGPCEPLIPILMYPAAKGSGSWVFLVVAVFGIATLATMLGVVFVSLRGLNKFSFGHLTRYSHALAGLIIFLCGGAIKFLGI